MELFILLFCVKRRAPLPSQLWGKAALPEAPSTHHHCVAVRVAKHGPTAQLFSTGYFGLLDGVERSDGRFTCR